MVDIVAHMRLQHHFLLFPDHASTIDKVSDQMSNFSDVGMCRDVIAIREYESRNCVWIFCQPALQFMQFHAQSIFLYWNIVKHLEKAREASARPMKLDPQSAEVHVAAAQGLSMEQRYADAAAEFERAIDLDPTLFDAHYYYARSSFKTATLKKLFICSGKRKRSGPTFTKLFIWRLWC